MTRPFRLALGGLLVLAVFSAPAFANGDIVKVMTRNQYLCADLSPILLAQTPEEFFAAVTTACVRSRRSIWQPHVRPEAWALASQAKRRSGLSADAKLLAETQSQQIASADPCR